QQVKQLQPNQKDQDIPIRIKETLELNQTSTFAQVLLFACTYDKKLPLQDIETLKKQIESKDNEIRKLKEEIQVRDKEIKKLKETTQVKSKEILQKGDEVREVEKDMPQELFWEVRDTREQLLNLRENIEIMMQNIAKKDKQELEHCQKLIILLEEKNAKLSSDYQTLLQSQNKKKPLVAVESQGRF
ncbi:hypothetical protein RFI_30091, partial [Reticulomyxa filosa]